MAFRQETRARESSWHNAPVDSFGDSNAALLIVGLAPGLSGANRTGRPFTGDWAGDLLYETLQSHRFARGSYERRADDGLVLQDCLVTNAVRCVPPANKPRPAEVAACRPFLAETIDGMPRLAAIVALGRIAHDSTLRALRARPSQALFGHGKLHTISLASGRTVTIFDSYHCSRYNTNTGVLTPAMFGEVFTRVRAFLGAAPN